MGLSGRTDQFLISISLILLNAHFQIPTTLGSEFPERECCDPVYPIPAPGSGNTLSAGHGAIAPAPAAFPEHAPPTPSSSVTTEIPGVQTKTATAIMNCIQARDFCTDNPACSPILEIVPRVCGPEKVACTTLTVNKCQAALRTLQAFPYFFPTCLCREPSSDPACNAFREYLFDHPCSFVKEKEKDPYSVDALPTCDYAMDVCKQQPKCHQLYRDFKTHCPAQGGTCKMDDGEICHGAWTKLRLSPMFGCICPNGGQRCDRIFSEVNYNPCVATEPASLNFTGTSSALSLDVPPRRRLYAQFSFTPSTLFPKPGTHMHRHQHQHQHSPQPAARTDSHLFVDESLSTPVSYHAIPSPGSFSTSHSGSLTVQVIANSHSPDHETDTQLETPLLGSPANVAEQQNKPPPFMPPIHSPPPPPKSTMSRQEGVESGRPHPRHSGGVATISSIRTHGGERSQGRVALHTTCSTALLNCQQTPACAKPLRNVLYWCEASRCRQETCMQALQNFYRGVQERYAIEVAFCLCRKSDHRLDQECLQAQRQLHPVCAQRGDLGISPPSCHSLAESCREQPDCKSRLETYEKACSVDSVTRKCAGPTTQCRNATVGILGTVLKKSCACNGTDYNQLYDCLGWQRILWVNPCVVESQRDYHRVRSTTSASPAPDRSTVVTSLGQMSTEDSVLMGADVASTTLGNPVLAYVDTRPEVALEKTTTTDTHPPTPRHHIRHQHSTSAHEVIFVTSRTSGVQTPVSTAEEFTTLITTTTRTPTSTAPPHKYCIVQRNNLPPQRILEGMARRFYREDRRSCSELCICSGIRLTASCNVLTCLDSTRSLSCSQKQRDNKTLMYSHEDPSYQANRGRCMCYAGSFVCVKPSQEKYNLNRGVFLFIGYSKVDQDVMRPYTNVDSMKVIETLRNLINPALHHHFANPADEGSGIEAFKELNTTECHLGLFKDEEENIIINATIADQEFGNFTLRQPNDELLIEEKTKCGPILQVLSTLINEKKPVIQSHPLLSILKLAEVVENKIPSMRSSGSWARRPEPFILLLLVLHCSIL